MESVRMLPYSGKGESSFDRAIILAFVQYAGSRPLRSHVLNSSVIFLVIFSSSVCRLSSVSLS